MATENLYTTDCIRTHTGVYMNVFEPTLDMICIEDIAHSLSQQCRFGGHLPSFFSVAQHSLNCSYFIENEELKLTALLHDASEAYLLDIPKPIKNRLANYREIENNLMYLISEKFGFKYPLPKEIKEVDEKMLQTEWYHLMLKNDTWRLPSYDANETKRTFIQMFNYYAGLTKSTDLIFNTQTASWDNTIDRQ